MTALEAPARPGLLARALGPFLRIADLDDADSRSEFWTFLAVGALPTAVLITLAGWGVAAVAPGLPAPGAALLAALAGLLALWWIAAVGAATRRRLEDAFADPQLALAWPAIPFAAMSGFAAPSLLLARFGLVDGETVWPTAYALAAAVPAALVVIALVPCLVPANRWPWPRARIMLVASLVLIPVFAVLALLVAAVARRVRRPNLATRLLLVGGVVALGFVIGAATPDAGARLVLALSAGGLLLGAHLLRWGLQTRHFTTTWIEVRYADGAVAVRDPRYTENVVLFHLFKALGAGWIVLAIVAVASGAFVSVSTGVLAGGFLASTGYLALGVVFAIALLLVPTPSGTTGALGAVDEALRAVAVPYLAVYAVVATIFIIRWWISRPGDRRFNATTAFRRYASASEW